MEFNKRYNRSEFVGFLQHKFLPEDFIAETTVVDIERQTKYISSITKLGSSELLDLVVYEIRHASTHDARVGLSKEAFRFLANEWESKALVLFIPEGNDANYRFSLITIDLNETEEGKIKRIYSNPRRYSYYLGEGVGCYTPNEYLNKRQRVADEQDLKSRFSVEVLTKAFYQELSDWYAWAVKVVRFPNKLGDTSDDSRYNSEAAIRLVTRLIFVWFLKQKNLIPDEFFDKTEINKLVKGFTPDRITDLMYMDGESVYYKAILQNLFFAMLNSPITPEGKDTISERRFSNADYTDHGNHKLMRYEKHFKDAERFLKIANATVPFLNGGLFDCLDRENEDYYVDGFSDREKVKKALFVPDYLFFIEDHTVDLSLWYNDKKKSRVMVNGIINILKRYNFTIEENTPFDQDVSLDPELLGKVFENLLASYNPETQTTARKQTGSFYTPREIVQYMVDESLVAHLKRTVGDELEPEYRKLISYVDDDIQLTSEQKMQVMESIYHCKVLDPACGSGAFPVGMLQQMVHILSQLDPTNEQWKEMMLNRAISETSEAYRTATDEERREMVADIERNFDKSINRPDYARKLYLIENCIYGVDIQPIAIQISKLRFFISLVVDQKTTNDPVNNFGIRPLPNLEAKFVAANSLIPLAKTSNNLGRTPDIIELENKLKEANHKIFSADKYSKKTYWKNRLAELRTRLAEKLASDGFLTSGAVNQIASWNMFDQNSAASFFDADWMFGIKDGFDIVIANPPYIDSETMERNMPAQRQLYKSLYCTAKGNWDMYIIFYELGMRLTTNSGILAYITPNKWLSIKYGEAMRDNYYNRMFAICDCQKIKVFEAGNEPIICFFKQEETPRLLISRYNENYIHEIINDVAKQDISANNLGLVISEHIELLLKIQSNRFLVSQFIDVENPFSTSEAYELIPIISDSNTNLQGKYKLINTGTIDPYVNLWGCQLTAYLKNKYLYPTIDRTAFAKLFPKRLRQAESPKIVISGMRYFECFYDEFGDYIAGKSTIILLNAKNKNVYKVLLAILNSKLMSFYIKQSFSTLGIGGGINFSKDMVAALPIPNFANKTDVITELVDIYLNNLLDVYSLSRIDLEVFRLYNLTYDEVLIVDPETPITREEYEKTVQI